MPSLPVLKILLRELVDPSNSPRLPEPSLVMDDAAQVAAYRQAGKEGNVMTPVYLFHCAQICDVIKPGDTVLDLGCGPANQLAMIARLNPGVRFIGLDLSDEMLSQAHETVRRQGLGNVSLRKGDITCLEGFADASVDAVFSTLVLHHLADSAQLECTFQEVDRILKSSGGLYLMDFGHLKTEAAIHYFAHQYADRQPELFTLDYLNSLRAAFHLTDWRAAYRRHLRHRGRMIATFLVPYMVAIKSPARRILPTSLRDELSALYRQLPPHHRTDFNDLRIFFRLGGLGLTGVDWRLSPKLF